MDSETVYNSVSVGSFFSRGGADFDSFWMDTGGNAELIVNIAKHVGFDISSDLRKPVTKEMMSSYDIIDMTRADVDANLLKSLLYQSGYLTISKALLNGNSFLLDFPNSEVREGFATKLLTAYAGESAKRAFSPYELLSYFESGDVSGAIEAMKGIYSAIPSVLEQKLNENAYHIAFYCMMKAVGADIDTEIASSKGRADAVLKVSGHIYVIEFKKDGSADGALAQIIEKEYASQYSIWAKTLKVHLVGICFSSKQRNISEWKEKLYLR